MANDQTPDFIPAPDGGGSASLPGVSKHSGHYIGEIFTWGADTPPAGCLLCDGSAVSRTTYAALFAVIGTTYGAGDGSTTFNLPDMRGRVAQGTPENGTTGTMIAAGLPEIAAHLEPYDGTTSQVIWGGTRTGAITAETRAGTSYISRNSESNTSIAAVDFSASRSNSIYGNSTTVQPPALHVNYVIVYE